MSRRGWRIVVGERPRETLSIRSSIIIFREQFVRSTSVTRNRHRYLTKRSPQSRVGHATKRIARHEGVLQCRFQNRVPVRRNNNDTRKSVDRLNVAITIIINERTVSPVFRVTVMVAFCRRRAKPSNSNKRLSSNFGRTTRQIRFTKDRLTYSIYRFKVGRENRPGTNNRGKRS